MNKPLNFDDAKNVPSEEAKKIPNSGDVKKFIDRAIKLEEDAATIRADQKAMYAEAKDQGIDPKSMKIVVRHKRNPIGSETAEEVNELSIKSGGQKIFAFV